MVAIAGLLMAMAAVPAHAQEGAGGAASAPPGTKYHFGAMTMLVSRARGVTTTPADDVMTGYPFGVLVMRGRVMFDLELMPMVQKGPLRLDVTVAPGVLVDVSRRMTLGARAAFEVKNTAIGVTPLFHYNWLIKGYSALFTESVVPIRIRQDATGKSFTSVGLGMAVGMYF
ncbi:MAG: hypothetical protein K2Y23_04080 [Cyanobacteria bacterium]|nr:hypothetical protein [Cyanobacteriota bacterium]